MRGTGGATDGALMMHAGLSADAMDAIGARFGGLLDETEDQAGVSAALKALEIDAACVRRCAGFDHGNRVRCEIARAPGWVLLAMFWEETASPIHDHCASECGFRVIEGELEETRFACAGDDLARAVATRRLRVGDFTKTPGSTIHQLGTPQGVAGARAISIHAYCPALCLETMGIFEATDPERAAECGGVLDVELSEE